MAHTSSPTTTMGIALDERAREMVPQLVPIVSAGYMPPPRQAYQGAPPPREVVDEAYVLTGALRVGLNCWTLPASPRPPVGTFVPQEGVLVVEVQVDVMDDDLARGQALADLIGVPPARVFSQALCTGLAMLIGDPAHRGPFEA